MDMSMLLQDASVSIIDWTDEDDDDDDDFKVRCFGNNNKSSSPVPLILVTDHLDEGDAESQKSQEKFKVILNADTDYTIGTGTLFRSRRTDITKGIFQGINSLSSTIPLKIIR